MKGRIFVGSLRQESNSFSPLKTDLDSFRIWRGEEMLSQIAVSSIFTEAGYEVIPSVCAYALPGGTVTLEAYRKLSDEMVNALPSDGSVEGVWLYLHGAMDVEFVGSGEALLVSRIREKIGPGVPIAIALDLHANNTYTLAKLANIMYGYRTAPHVDAVETQQRAARLLLKALDENILPWTELIRIPVLLPGEAVVTTSGPGKEIIEKLPEIEAAEGVWCASYFAGMPWVDCPQNGSAVVVSGIGDRAPAMRELNKMARYIWSMREDFSFQDVALSPEASLELALNYKDKPVFISDSADNVTAGSAGDNAYFLKLLLEKGCTETLLAGLADKSAVAECSKAGEGAEIKLTLGGTLDPGSVKADLNVKIKSLRFGQDGQVNGAMLSVGGLDILIAKNRESVTTVKNIESFGADVNDYKIIVVKLGYMFPDLARISKLNILALTSGNSALDVTLLKYYKLRMPMYPLDKSIIYEPDL